VNEWAGLLRDSPFIAMIIALGITVVYLFRSKDRLQTKYTQDLVQATSALQELTSEYLKQAFADSAAWQDRYKALEDAITKHTAEDGAHHERLEGKLERIDRTVERLSLKE